jgi:repressor LexA
MIGVRLKQLREEKRMTQKELADLLQLTPKAISFYELGERQPSNEILVKLANYFHVSADYLLGKIEMENEKDTNKGVQIPILGKIVAGIPIKAITDIEDYEEIPRDMANRGSYYGLKITGHSMEPELREGDIVIVKQQDDVDSGDIAIVFVNGDEATIKEIKKTDKGIILIGYNVAVYPPHLYTCEEVKKLPVKIAGIVVEIRRKIK